MSTVDIYETKYPPAEIVDWEKKSDAHNHGEIGHIGYRCGQCAQISGKTVGITKNTIDYWQTKQIEWQEECDYLQVQFDQEMSDHLPVHLPQNCQTCPSATPMPPKPLPPIERALGWKITGDED